MRKIYSTLIIIFIFFLVLGCSDQDVPAPAASNDSHHLDADLLKAYADRLARDENNKTDHSLETILEHVQNMEALIVEGRARGFTDMPQYRQAVHQFKAELMHRVLQPDLVPEIPRESISDEEVRAFFEENISSYSLPDLYSVTMMSMESKDVAEEFLSAVQEGLSIDDQTEMHDVELQTLKSMPLIRYPQEWQNLLENFEPGEKSSILEHGDGFVVLRLDAVEKNRTQDFEERKEYIRNDALYAHYNQAWRDTYAQLRATHNISVDEEEADRFINSLDP